VTVEEYREIDATTVQRLSDGACIPFDELNDDYRRYLADVENGASVLAAGELADDGAPSQPVP
jgi:hypothetical protein